VLSIVHEEMKGGATKEEVLIEQEDVHLIEQTRVISTNIHEQS
jgi:hypothetical protein